LISSFGSLSIQNGGEADLRAAVLDGEATESDALVGSEQRVALDHFDALEGNRQLFRRDLRDGSAHPGAEVDLAREDRDFSVGADGDEAVHRRRRRRTQRRLRGRGRRWRRLGLRGEAGQRKGDDERS
jgi:hypothetical protein